MNRAILLLFVLAGSFLGSCASPSTRMGTDPLPSDDAKVDANAYGSDHFTFAKKMKIRPANDYIFYFKHCNLVSRRDPNAFYMQSEYGCTPPP